MNTTLEPVIFLTVSAAIGFAMLGYLETGDPPRSKQCFRTSSTFSVATIVLAFIYAVLVL